MNTRLGLLAFVLCSVAVLLVQVPSYGDTPRTDLTLEEVRAKIAAEGLSWTADETEISLLPVEEREKLLGLVVPDDYEARLQRIHGKAPAYSPLDLPSRFDWTDSAGVSPVRRQLCGDCWCQCAVAAMESKIRIFDDDNTRLSVQQGIDCNFGGSSCNGGWMEDVYDLYRVVGGVTQACYPYRGGVNGSCDQDTCDLVMNVDSWEYIDTTVTSIKTHLMTNGPIAVGMTVFSDFNYYSGGCYEHTGGGSINHGVLIVGWDDSKCGGEGAWHVKNSWGIYWGEAGYVWMKYGSADIGYGAAIVHYTPRTRARLCVDSFVIDDSADDGDGIPDAGEAITLPLTLENRGWETGTGVSAIITSPDPGVTITTASASFPDIPPRGNGQSGSPHFAFSVDPSVLCGTRLHFIISTDSNQGVSTDEFEMLVGDAGTVFFDDVETDLGWSLEAQGDDATDGNWRWVNPRGSLQDSLLVQAELDHTPESGIRAFVTKNTNRGFTSDFADVDNGRTTLTSPVIDLSGYASALLRYWRWYTNDTGESVEDVWQVDVSGDSGATWVNLESETASERNWVPMEYDLGGYIPLTDKTMVRFVAGDYYDDSVVEAAVDDIEITGSPYSVDVSPPLVSVLSPNGGEVLEEGEEYEIAWEASDDYGVRYFTLAASYDGGSTYDDTIGVVGGLDGSLVWEAPVGDHPACKIGIQATDRGYNSGFDESDGTFSITSSSSVDEPATDLPARVELIGSEINPFTGSTHICFALPGRTAVTIRIYDAEGRVARDLADRAFGAGYHSVLWDGRNNLGVQAAPGMYFVRLDAGSVGLTSKVILVN